MNLRILLAFSLLLTPPISHAGGIGAIFGALLGGVAGNTVGKAATSQMIEKLWWELQMRSISNFP